MKVNEGVLDRLIRVLLSFVVAGLGWLSWPGTGAVVLLAIGAILFATGAVGWCPAYTVFHVSTNKGARA
jgi:hypothetical protein